MFNVLVTGTIKNLKGMIRVWPLANWLLDLCYMPDLAPAGTAAPNGVPTAAWF